MPRSDEAENFFAAVYQAIQEIPPGKVTSYGHIARLIGRRERAQPLGAMLQAEMLAREGVEIERSHMGELTVDITRYGWFPQVLPSEDDDEEGGEGEEGEEGGGRG
ncbi:MAG: hypothetical protein M1826_004782 [Phylliscum demangeonii]|nr:MAG: hypothetical protein M1826_004782 [Phylliscum demangeonii]